METVLQIISDARFWWAPVLLLALLCMCVHSVGDLIKMAAEDLKQWRSTDGTNTTG